MGRPVPIGLDDPDPLDGGTGVVMSGVAVEHCQRDGFDTEAAVVIDSQPDPVVDPLRPVLAGGGGEEHGPGRPTGQQRGVDRLHGGEELTAADKGDRARSHGRRG